MLDFTSTLEPVFSSALTLLINEVKFALVSNDNPVGRFSILSTFFVIFVIDRLLKETIGVMLDKFVSSVATLDSIEEIWVLFSRICTFSFKPTTPEPAKRYEIKTY